jgi:hypothetical protein
MFDVDLYEMNQSTLQLSTLEKILKVQTRLYFYKHKEKNTLCKLRTRYYQISFSPFARGG